MNSGRILVNGSSFYCGNSTSSLCQLALKTDVPAQYVHPSTKVCDYSYIHPTSKQCTWTPDLSGCATITKTTKTTTGSGSTTVNSGSDRQGSWEFYLSNFSSSSMNDLIDESVFCNIVSISIDISITGTFDGSCSRENLLWLREFDTYGDTIDFGILKMDVPSTESRYIRIPANYSGNYTGKLSLISNPNSYPIFLASNRIISVGGSALNFNTPLTVGTSCGGSYSTGCSKVSISYTIKLQVRYI